MAEQQRQRAVLLLTRDQLRAHRDGEPRHRDRAQETEHLRVGHHRSRSAGGNPGHRQQRRRQGSVNIGVHRLHHRDPHQQESEDARDDDANGLPTRQQAASQHCEGGHDCSW